MQFQDILMVAGVGFEPTTFGGVATLTTTWADSRIQQAEISVRHLEL